jgi:hypothetical protein
VVWKKRGRDKLPGTVLVEKELAIFKVHSDSDSVAHGVALARVRRGVVVIQLPRRVVRPPVQRQQFQVSHKKQEKWRKKGPLSDAPVGELACVRVLADGAGHDANHVIAGASDLEFDVILEIDRVMCDTCG